MHINAHLNYFSIEECGLYKHSKKEPQGLLEPEVFDLIYNWVKGKAMEDTIPWDPKTAKSGLAKCYCHDVYHCDENEEFLFVLWKSDTDSNGSILGAQAGAETGKSSVVEYTDNYRGKKMIWGRPAYYWILPKLKLIVSIKVEHSVCDSGLLQEWITKSITNRIQHPNKKIVQTETGQVRFEFTDGSDITTSKYAFRFDAHLKSINTDATELRDIASRVTHIIRRDTIKLNTGIDERPSWVKMFDNIPYLPAKQKAKTRQIEVKAEARPSAYEIKQIIEKFAKENRKRSDWDNVGFQTDTSTIWVDRYRLHESISLETEVGAVFSAADLFDRLDRKRDFLLRNVYAALKTDKRRAAS